MPRFKLLVAYDGTSFGGWQAQVNAPSIQNLIEGALQTILRIPTPVTGSGRTDAGVHARGQTAHFDAPSSIDCFRLRGSMNGLLPAEIRILAIEEVSPNFHARYSARSKEYHYHLHLDQVLDPFKRLYATHLHASVDLHLLEKAAQIFVGTHDFTSFANDADEGSAAKNPIRTLSKLDVIPEAGGVRLEFEADGFLYKMVRNITGTLIDVARGKTPFASIPEIFGAKDRRRAGAAAPPQGLFLEKVNYGQTL